MNLESIIIKKIDNNPKLYESGYVLQFVFDSGFCTSYSLYGSTEDILNQLIKYTKDTKERI